MPKISELPIAEPLTGDEQFVVVQNGQTKQSVINPLPLPVFYSLDPATVAIASSSYTNVNGPMLTVPVGASGKCLVILSAVFIIDGGFNYVPEGFMGFAIGQQSVDTRCIINDKNPAATYLVETTPGEQTFTVKIKKASGSTVNISNRSITVIPL